MKKNILALMLAVTMVMGFSQTAFAYSGPAGQETKQATLASAKKASKTAASKTTNKTTKKAEDKSAKESTEAAKPADIKKEISNLSTWSASLWNHVANLKNYRDKGLNQSGKTMDVNSEHNQYQSDYTQIQTYTDFINSLSGSQYDSLKAAWASVVSELSNINSNLNKNGLKQGAGSIDTTKLKQSLDTVWKNCTALAK